MEEKYFEQNAFPENETPSLQTVDLSGHDNIASESRYDNNNNVSESHSSSQESNFIQTYQAFNSRYVSYASCEGESQSFYPLAGAHNGQVLTKKVIGLNLLLECLKHFGSSGEETSEVEQLKRQAKLQILKFCFGEFQFSHQYEEKLCDLISERNHIASNIMHKTFDMAVYRFLDNVFRALLESHVNREGALFDKSVLESLFDQHRGDISDAISNFYQTRYTEIDFPVLVGQEEYFYRDNNFIKMFDADSNLLTVSGEKGLGFYEEKINSPLNGAIVCLNSTRMELARLLMAAVREDGALASELAPVALESVIELEDRMQKCDHDIKFKARFQVLTQGFRLHLNAIMGQLREIEKIRAEYDDAREAANLPVSDRSPFKGFYELYDPDDGFDHAFRDECQARINNLRGEIEVIKHTILAEINNSRFVIAYLKEFNGLFREEPVSLELLALSAKVLGVNLRVFRRQSADELCEDKAFSHCEDLDKPITYVLFNKSGHFSLLRHQDLSNINSDDCSWFPPKSWRSFDDVVKIKAEIYCWKAKQIFDRFYEKEAFVGQYNPEGVKRILLELDSLINLSKKELKILEAAYESEQSVVVEKMTNFPAKKDQFWREVEGNYAGYINSKLGSDSAVNQLRAMAKDYYINEPLFDKKNTLLHMAILKHRHVDAISFLLSLGASLFQENENHESPFELAYLNRENYPNIHALVSKHVFCELTRALSCSNPAERNSAFESLKDQGFEINAFYFVGGNTALHMAVLKNLGVESILTLLENGADVYSSNDLEMTPWDIARQNMTSDPVVYNLLTEAAYNKNKETLLAVNMDYTVKKLIETLIERLEPYCKTQKHEVSSVLTPIRMRFGLSTLDQRSEAFSCILSDVNKLMNSVDIGKDLTRLLEDLLSFSQKMRGATHSMKSRAYEMSRLLERLVDYAREKHIIGSHNGNETVGQLTLRECVREELTVQFIGEMERLQEAVARVTTERDEALVKNRDLEEEKQQLTTEKKKLLQEKKELKNNLNESDVIYAGSLAREKELQLLLQQKRVTEEREYAEEIVFLKERLSIQEQLTRRLFQNQQTQESQDLPANQGGNNGPESEDSSESTNNVSAKGSVNFFN